ncbi:FAD-binding oxidoreductase [Rhizobium sp. EC-SD404]|uniref:FAD-binding oxidoreductase n=1 Tax=Rhizobium sp. EC-SD404 TaxID=2038389 RepID=UPI00125BE07D|nr:FAD-binding oxidoreductase [Rhizobium sp. EC-SD404]VVT27365.1 FAD/FMN-containing dehydrogenase [Rhizobium sp. EC-SD404]
MSLSPSLSPSLIERFAAIVGPGNALTDPSDTQGFTHEHRDLYQATTPLVLRPGTKEEVAAILKLATETKTAIIPQGGNTGLTGGQVPLAEGPPAVILSLSRMNRILDIDAIGGTMTVEAGVVLQTIQESAAEVGKLFPLSLGAEGSCQIGGNLSTNAGGTAVLAYGNTRQLCLGLEVVLPTGEVWTALRKLKKDNTGYDLRDLFIGAEGTLGVITAAVLKLFPMPAGREVAIVGLTSPDAALKLFRHAEALSGSALTAFELMARIGVEFTARHIDGVRDPFAEPHDWYVLIEISSNLSADAARHQMEALLSASLEDGTVDDAVVAQNETQAQQFWHMREALSWAQKPEGGSIKHDISVPVAAIPAFLAQAEPLVQAIVPGARIVAFGHLGDGNIHYNISQPVGADRETFLARWDAVSAKVHALALSFGGSISAEHGIGQMKRDELAAIRAPIEIDLMQRIKAAFDPAGIMNPGKVLQTR